MLMNLAALAEADIAATPFPYLVASNVLRGPALAMLGDDFPKIDKPGVFPLSQLRYGAVFSRLIEEIRAPELQSLLEQKFQIPLADKPLMITVRGQCARRDGRIHADSTDKVLTCLLYLNEPGWVPAGGRLRLLRRPDDLNDAIAEVPPAGGNFIAFKRTDQSWHGHEPYEGTRRIVMFNWLTGNAAYLKNIGRHKLSATFKKLGGSYA